MNIDTQINQIVQQVIADLKDNIQTEVMDIVSQQIDDVLKTLDFQSMFTSALTNAVATSRFPFPKNSIPSSALNFGNLVLSGDYIQGGIIKEFGSTGIEDRATACQLTIMDDVTVVENNLLTQDLTVKGSATIEGDLTVTGTVPESSPFYQQMVRSITNNVTTGLDQIITGQYLNLVLVKIKQEGLDLNKITVNGSDVVSGSNLGDGITYSNLQRVGALQELQVLGETVLSQTLYTTNKRVGINTLEPSQTLTVWDQEVEIGLGKYSSNTGILGIPRNQSLILSVNQKNNLTITPDGGVTVNQLTLGGMTMTTSDTPPSTNQPKGTLVYNSSPTLGGPLGWISLGDARWANFGYID